MLELSPVLSASGRIAVGLVLLVAAVAKLRSNAAHPFRDAILGYDLVPKRVASLLSRIIPPLELVLGLLLVVGIWTAGATALAFALIAAFTAAVAASLARGRRNHCGCVGFSAAQVVSVQWRLVYRNLALLACLVADAAAAAPLGLDRLLPGTSSSLAPASFRVMAACLVAGACLVAATHLHRHRAGRSAAPTDPAG